ncbi:hypothetical protein [Chelativorans sp. YIM 93263]|uniref:hypothetical protein n=1 Tax=Chelativorans sp. YIM 93263 TaxID=2906648 RepID=UPI00237989A0|nr:hypothetical protein [Chelativorans sp. YIM 93263]
MKRILKVAAVPLLVSGAFTGAAFADSNNVEADAQINGNADVGSSEADAGADAGISADGGNDMSGQSGIDTGTTASTGGEANFGSVISAIQAGGTAAGDVEAVTDASNIEIVRVSDLAQGESMNAVDEALANNQTSIDELRTAVEASSTVSQRLEQEQFQTEDVVAAESSADGSLTLYVR